MDLPILFVCSYLPSSVLTMYPVACCHRPVVPFYPVSRRRQVLLYRFYAYAGDMMVTLWADLACDKLYY